jgi:hypothetical protein
MGTMPPDATFVDHLDGTGDFGWTTAGGDSGMHPVLFIASDGQTADSERITTTASATGFFCGDANDDGWANVGDAFYLINYVFKGGAAPECS